jgi:hypothetical protein
MTKREKWMLHRLEFQRLLQGYEASGKDPIHHLRPGADHLTPRIAELLEWSEDDVRSSSLASLRELVRPLSVKLAAEITRKMECIISP